MKMKYKIFFTLIGLILITACHDLDLNPLAEGSSASWYADESQINLSLNDLYREAFWPLDEDVQFDNNPWTDDHIRRNFTSVIVSGTINGQWGVLNTWWSNSYKAISRANTILLNLDRVSDDLSETTINRFVAEARFVRASQYATLISHFGDVVFFTDILDLEEAFTQGKTDKTTVLQAIYEDYDFAAQHLPETYGSSELKRATKGAALAMKARIALYQGDWTVARNAAKMCMDLGRYQLYPDFGELFLPKTRNTDEVIFAIPRSEAFNSTIYIRDRTPRNPGGYSARNPSWDLFCSFLCSDGLPIDESPLFNPQEPFRNRDPRCTETIVEFQTPFLGFMYQPHPDSTQVWNFNTGQYQTNNDTRSIGQYASYNGLALKKGIDESWTDDNQADPEKKIIRFADVLLIYAEASIELNQIDQTVLDAMNMVRARAYKVSKDQIESYPEITTTDQAELRKLVRIERRMEFSDEGLRYMDIIRWRIAEKVLNRDTYGMLDVTELREKVVNPGLWFFPWTPEIDEDGSPDFSSLYNAGLIKLLSTRDFDASKQYLWPIPTSEILINENLDQNPGY
jgi:hypothetical protein